MEKLTNYEKALLRIELMKLKQYKIDIGKCNAPYRDKRDMEEEIENTKKFIENIMKTKEK